MKIVLEDLLTQEDIRPYLDILFEAEVDSVLKDGNNIMFSFNGYFKVDQIVSEFRKIDYELNNR